MGGEHIEAVRNKSTTREMPNIHKLHISLMMKALIKKCVLRSKTLPQPKPSL